MKDFIHAERGHTIAGMFAFFLIFLLIFTYAGGFRGIDVINKDYIPPEDQIENITFSHESGFYDEPFYLDIGVPEGVKVYYTLDCTDPDTNSTEYTGPIYLENATQHENVYSMRTDVSAGFYSDLIELAQTNDPDPHYTAPDFPVEKCNILRLRVITDDGRKSKIITKSYFVGMTPSDFGDVNFVTVITDPDNLFSSDKGIYVTGDTFIKYIQSGNIKENWRFWEANYRQKGKDWQREASISFFDRNGDLICDQQNGAIRIQGGVSRGTVPRSLNLFAGNSEKREKQFHADFFGTGYEPQKITLASGGNRLWAKMNDVFIADRCSSLSYSTMHYQPYILFLDGEYWGFYWLAEKYDAAYLNHYYDVSKDNVVIIKDGNVEVGDESCRTLYENLLDEITSLDMTDNANFQRACELVDIDSFTDYYATMVYISRQGDWPVANFALWRSIEVREDAYSDGKWRWLMFDCNSKCMSIGALETDSIHYTMGSDKLFKAFWQNRDFQERFLTRMKEIGEAYFDPLQVAEYVDRYDREMRSILEKSWTRFHGSSNAKSSDYNMELDDIRTFFSQRRAIVDAWPY